MIAFLRLLSLVAALLGLISLSAHRMDIAPEAAATMVMAAMPGHEGHGAPTGSAERGTCQIHCLAAAPAALSVPAVPVALVTAGPAAAPTLPRDGLSPAPLGPPPKPLSLA